VVLLSGSLIALAPSVMLVVSGLLAVFYLLVFRFTRGTLKADGEQLTINYQSSLQVAQESLGGIRDVLLDRSQDFFLESYGRRNRAYRLASAAINIKAQVPRYLIEGFVVLLIVGLSLLLAASGQGIERQLPLLGTLALGAYRLLQPLQQCFSSFIVVQAHQASLHRLQPFLKFSPSSVGSLHVARQLPSLNPGDSLLELSQVSFRYGTTGPLVLCDLQLSIRPGERLAFVGTTGSGKSTTSDLILGLLSPSKGNVFVHGQDLHRMPGILAAWQDRVAHVPQQIYLSDSSFAANIAFGVPDQLIVLDRVRQAAEKACIADLIEASPNGYDTVVGERGVRLSGGQRQRIGIARALYRQAELLVLDEATSALDNLTEAEVMRAIDSLDRTITVILIAHRLSTVQRCDRIVLLEHGQITGLGTYQQLEAVNKSFQAIANQPGSIIS
jgi:ATP-binding cassette subfamily B protein